MSLFEFKKQAVRDLAWVMRSPGLMAPPSMKELAATENRATATTVVADIDCRRTYEQNLGWIVALERNTAILQQWLEQRESHRLGYYFESLLEFWLRHQVAKEELYCHVQVSRNNQTLGEFDYLFHKDLNDIGLHWEAAVKFYLLQVDSLGQAQWLGPNTNDSLDAKLTRLTQHQLCLSTEPEGRATLEQLGFEQVRSELFLKGYLFYPLQYHKPVEHCAGMRISRCHLKGWWCRYPFDQLPQIKPGSRWIMLEKSNWLSPAYLDINSTDEAGWTLLMTHDQLSEFCRQHFEDHTRSLLFAEMIQAAEGCWQEVKRGFVVHPNWPSFN